MSDYDQECREEARSVALHTLYNTVKAEEDFELADCALSDAADVVYGVASTLCREGFAEAAAALYEAAAYITNACPKTKRGTLDAERNARLDAAFDVFDEHVTTCERLALYDDAVRLFAAATKMHAVRTALKRVLAA